MAHDRCRRRGGEGTQYRSEDVIRVPWRFCPSESQAHPSVRQQGTHPIDHSPVKPQAETPPSFPLPQQMYVSAVAGAFVSQLEVTRPRPGHLQQPVLHEHHFASSDGQKAHFTDIRHRTEESGRTGAKSIAGPQSSPRRPLSHRRISHYAYPVLPHESFSESRPPHGATECGLYEERAGE